jgi:tetratricopeptide (TPR) repeat protein
MADHHLAAGLWLALALGGIGYAAKAGLEGSARHHREAERAEHTARLTAAIADVQQGRVDEGIAGLEALARDRPGDPAIEFNLALALRFAKRPDDADRQLAKIIAARPEDWDAHAERATLAAERSDLARALELLAPIPPGGGNLGRRFREDAAWEAFAQDPRAIPVFERHGFSDLADTALRFQEVQRAATATTTPAAP